MVEPGKDNNICVLCKLEIKENDEVNKLGKTGVKGIQKVAKQSNNTVSVEVSQMVHVACCRDYIHC